jgi:hypothetical protein
MRSIIIGFLLCTLFLILVSCVDQHQLSSSSTMSNTSSARSSATSVTAQATSRVLARPLSTQQIKISSIVTFFYQAVESKNYSTAFSYLSSNAITANGQKLTSDTFRQRALSMDSNEGRVNNFLFLISTDNPPQVVVTLTRTSGLHYHAHIQMKQDNGSWKIMQLDRI